MAVFLPPAPRQTAVRVARRCGKSNAFWTCIRLRDSVVLEERALDASCLVSLECFTLFTSRGARAIYDALTSRKSAARRNDGGVSRVMGSFRADAERARGEGSARARDEGAGALIILLELVVGVDVKIVVV